MIKLNTINKMSSPKTVVDDDNMKAAKGGGSEHLTTGMADNSSHRMSCSLMDNSSVRRSSGGSRFFRVPSLGKAGRRFSAGSTTSMDDDSVKERKSWSGMIRNLSIKSTSSALSYDDDSSGELNNEPKAARHSMFTKRVSQFFKTTDNHHHDNQSNTTNKKRSSRAEVGASWAHQTVKIRPNLFVTQIQGQLEDDYEVGRLLGQGGYGQVFECTHRETGAERAVKKMIIKSDSDAATEAANAEIMEEFAVLRELEHPNILKNYALYQGEEHFSVVTDLYKGGDLLDLIHERTLSEGEAALFAKHVLSCINYCHINGIVHRDLKPDNILLEETMNLSDIKIIDFGLAARINQNTTSGDNSDDEPGKFSTTAGSSYYMSPQIIEGSYTKACDIWAIGVIIYMLMSGYAPFDGDDDHEIVEQILDGTVYFDDEVWDDISDDALDFVEYLLTVSEEDRPTAEQALQHPWLKKCLEDNEDNNETNCCNNKQESIQTCWEGLKNFSANGKLQQVVYSLIASQLLSKKDRECIDHDFRTLDVDCDGKLSRQDLQTSYKDHIATTGGGDNDDEEGSKDLDEEELDRIMKAVDYSNTGTIDYSEFVAATMVQKKLITQEMLTSVFHTMDEDHTGYISGDNIHKALGLEKGSMESYVRHKIIEPVDSTGNGTISLEDFIKMMMPSSSSDNDNNNSNTKTTTATNNQKNSKSSRRRLRRPTGLTRTFRNTLNSNTNRIAAFSNNMVSGISSGTQSIVSGIASGSNNVVSGISSGTQSIVSGIATGSNNVVSGISSGTQTIVSGIASGSNNVVSGISSGTQSIVSGIASSSNNVVSGISSGSKSIAAGVSTGSKSMVSGISSGSKSIAAGVSTGSKSMVSGLSSGRKSIAAGVSSGSKSIAGLVTSSVTSKSNQARRDSSCKETAVNGVEATAVPTCTSNTAEAH